MVNSDVQKISKYALGIDTAVQVKEPTLVFDVNPINCNDLDFKSGELSDATSVTIMTTPTTGVFRLYGVILSACTSAANSTTKIQVNGTKNSQVKAFATMRKTASTAASTASITAILQNPIILDKGTDITITATDGTASIGAVATLFYTISER